MMALSEQGGFADYLIPGFEHDIGLLSDEWRIGFRYENPIVIGKDGCEERSEFTLGMKELK